MSTQIVQIENTAPPFDPVETEQDLWLKERRKGLGGSDVHNLFPDESRYGCPLRLWFDKTDIEPDYKRTDRKSVV